MKLKYIFGFFFIFLLFLTGCSDNNNSNQKYNVVLKALNSDNDVIESVTLTVNGISGDNGVLNIDLKAGTYTVTAEDNSGVYTISTQQFIVTCDTVITVHMFKNYKEVFIQGIMNDSNDLLSRCIVNIPDQEGFITDNGTVFVLEVGNTYSVTLSDPQDFYMKTTKEFKVDNTSDFVKIVLPKNPTGFIQGDLYMVSSYNEPVLLNYGHVYYFDNKVLSRDNGYIIELPEGDRTISVKTLFGGEATVDVNIVAGQTVIKNINVPLPDEDNFVDKWREVKGSYDDILGRWNRNVITYAIDFTDWVREVRENTFFGLDYLADELRIGVMTIDTALVDIIDYQEIDDYDSADVKILVCHAGDSLIGNAKGKLTEQLWNEKEIVGSTIYINSAHIVSNGQVIVAHELGHSLSLGHSSDAEDLMYHNPVVRPDVWLSDNSASSDRYILGLLYSLPYPTNNPFFE